MVASGSFVPVLPIVVFVGGGGVPFIVIVLGAVSDDKNVGEEGRERASQAGGWMRHPSDQREGVRETKSTFGQFVTGILNGVCSPPPSPSRTLSQVWDWERAVQRGREESQLIRRDDKAEKVPFCLSPLPFHGASLT